jgi:NAD+ kinase
MLSNRPLVVGDHTRIEARLRDARGVEVYTAFDGQQSLALDDGDAVVVSASARRLRLVKAPGRDYYEVLRTKLKWGDSTARKSLG